MTDDERRWALIVPHRERLLALARRLVRDRGDAEACVQEAMLRCATFATLDESNVTGFLVTTVRRLCVDHHRGYARDGRVAAKLTGTQAAEPAPEDAVCDRAEAAWISDRLADLPARQLDAVLARAEGRSVGEIATTLDVSYKTVETLLYRVRSRVRAELRATYGSVLLVLARRPRLAFVSEGIAPALVVTSVLLAPPAYPRLSVANPPNVSYTVVPAATTAPRPSQIPEPGPTPAAGLATPAPEAARGSHPTGSPTPFRCPDPPYLADPCVSPNPTNSPLDGALDCVLYGIDREVGFGCKSSPTPTPEDRP